MEIDEAIAALASLAQPTRLEAFRLLVRHEPEGLPAGELARRGFIPAKGLPAKEGGGQIERNGELQGGHGGEKLKG